MNDKEKGILQIDNNYQQAYCEFVEGLISQGITKMALMVGNSKYVVNNTRISRFKKAFSDAGIELKKEWICIDCDSSEKVQQAMMDFTEQQIE